MYNTNWCVGRAMQYFVGGEYCGWFVCSGQ